MLLVGVQGLGFLVTGLGLRANETPERMVLP